MAHLTGKDRLIVALDVPTRSKAVELVGKLEGVVHFYKIGWELWIGGEAIELLKDLRGKRVFVDLKVPGDIGNTITRVVEVCIDLGVSFLTLSDSMSLQTMRTAKGVTKGGFPKLLAVPFLSNLDETDLPAVSGGSGTRLADYLVRRSQETVAAGCDGVICSGREIELVRKALGKDALIVSPGIRSEGSPTQDHKRFATPADATRMGADYIVVGRPIRDTPDPRKAAQTIIDEMDRAQSGGPPHTPPSPMRLMGTEPPLQP